MSSKQNPLRFQCHKNISEDEKAFQKPDPRGEIKGVNPTSLPCYLISQVSPLTRSGVTLNPILYIMATHVTQMPMSLNPTWLLQNKISSKGKGVKIVNLYLLYICHQLSSFLNFSPVFMITL